jgi:pimeloyl-ACP methyl ester carboxylesterase
MCEPKVAMILAMLPLIQIPALGCDVGLYLAFDAALSQHVRAQTIVPIADRMDACAAQVLARAPAEFIVLGTSFGGRVAIEVALAAPEKVKGLIVIGGGPGPVVDQASVLHRSARVRGGEFENVLQEMGDMVSHLPGPRGRETMEAFRAMGREMGAEKFALQSDALAHRTDLWPRVAEIKCPVLCIWGEHDQFTSVDVGAKIAATVPNGKFIALKDCGHFPTLEYPEEAAKVVVDWLNILARNAGEERGPSR